MQSGLIHTDLRLSSFLQISKSGRERTVAVDLEIDGTQPSSSSSRGTEQGERGTARGATFPGVIDGNEGGGRRRRSRAASGYRRRRRR